MFTENTVISRWCTGSRSIPVVIANYYTAEKGIRAMKNSFRNKILPNLLNAAKARQETEELLRESIPFLTKAKYEELNSPSPDEDFFTGVILFVIQLPTGKDEFRSPSLVNKLISNHLPEPIRNFIGRSTELKECGMKLSAEKTLFVSGLAGIGKSEFIKQYGKLHQKKYTNIIYFFYSGSLKKAIADMSFSFDRSDMTTEERFAAHYHQLQLLENDSLIILDNFDCTPSEDPFFTEFAQNHFQILISTRCRIDDYAVLDLDVMANNKDLITLFASHCQISQSEIPTVKDIIDTVHSHTMTIILAALTMKASGLTAAELLEELKASSLSMPDQEDVELFKDGSYSEALMKLHLKTLLRLQSLAENQKELLMNISLLPESGMRKKDLKQLLELSELRPVNQLIRHGILSSDANENFVWMHPLIREIVLLELQPTFSNCAPLTQKLTDLCAVQAVEFSRHKMIINVLLSIIDSIGSEPGSEERQLRFLQGMYMFLEKYDAHEEIPQVLKRMEDLLAAYPEHEYADEALLLDFQAQTDMNNRHPELAISKRQQAIKLLEPIVSIAPDARSTALLANLYNNLAMCYVRLNQPQEALNAFQNAVDIRKQAGDAEVRYCHDSVALLFNLAASYIQNGYLNYAEQLIRIFEENLPKETVNLSADHAFLHLLKGMLFIVKKNFSEAEDHLRIAEESFTSFYGTDNEHTKSVYFCQCILYLNTGRVLQAAKLAREHQLSFLLKQPRQPAQIAAKQECRSCLQ